MTIPILAIGIATLYVTAKTAVVFFAGVLLVVLIAIALLVLREKDREEVQVVDTPG
jgi:hypothetical protein